jgi:hypothetical protein
VVVERPPALDELLPGAGRRVLHLEMRDHYEGSPAYETWLVGGPIDYERAYGPWLAMVSPVVARGVDFRRARVVSEPISSYVRFEYSVTPYANLAAGERVRWLPRGRASELRLPGNDFWLVDDVVLFSLFSGDGVRVGTVVGGADALAFAVEAFEAVWRLGTDHTDYQPA